MVGSGKQGLFLAHRAPSCGESELECPSPGASLRCPSASGLVVAGGVDGISSSSLPLLPLSLKGIHRRYIGPYLY